MAIRRTCVIVLLAMVWAQCEVSGQVSSAPAADQPPATIAIRDSQGKTVSLPAPNPAQPVNYVKWLNETLGGGIKDNAAALYEEAFKLHKPMKVEPAELDKALAGPWENLPGVAAWLDANRACLDKFRQASSKRQCYFQLSVGSPEGSGQAAPPKQPKDPRLADLCMDVVLPNLSPHRDACKALIAEGWQAWKQGNEERIIANSLAVLRSARHLDDQPTLIQHLVGVACAAMGYEALRTAMSLSRDPDALAGRLAAKLTAADPPLDPRSVPSLMLEPALFARDACQRVFMPGAKPGTWRVSKNVLDAISGSAGSEGGKISGVLTTMSLAHIGYEATLGEINGFSSRFQQWLEKPYHESLKAKEELDAAVVGSKNPLIRLVMPSLTGVRAHDEARIASRRATHLIVQLLLHHAKKHSFPEGLEDLKAANLRELRIDPFSGKDFVYRKQGEGFVLYSIGKDLQDSGGRHDGSWKTGDFIFWPVQEKSKAK